MSTATPPPGFMPISTSIMQGYRKKEGMRWRYWYPTRAHAREDAAHHKAEMARHAADFDRLSEQGSKDGPAGRQNLGDMDRALFAMDQHHMHSRGAELAAMGANSSHPMGAFQVEGITGEDDEAPRGVGTQHESVNLHYTRYTPENVAEGQSFYVGDRFMGHDLPEGRLDRIYSLPEDSPHRWTADEHGRPIVPEGYAAYHAAKGGRPIVASHKDVAHAATLYRRQRALEDVQRTPLVKSSELHHPPPGFSPIPGSTHQGFHKQVDGKWEQWYPSVEHATQARDHHYAEADAHAAEARSGNHLETGRKFHERMANKHRDLGDLADAAANRRRKGTPSHASDGPPAGFAPVKRKNMMGETVTDPHQLHHKVEADGSESYWSPSPEHAAASVKFHEDRASDHAAWAAQAEDAGLHADGHEHLREIHQEIADGARHLAAPLHKARSARLVRGLIALFRSLSRAEAVPMSKGLPDQLVQADPNTIDVLEKWDEDGYTCQVRKAAGGAQYLTIEGGNLPIPYHAIVADAAAARRTASNAIPLFRRNRSPREGVYRRTGTRKQGPRTGYGVFV